MTAIEKQGYAARQAARQLAVTATADRTGPWRPSPKPCWRGRGRCCPPTPPIWRPGGRRG